MSSSWLKNFCGIRQSDFELIKVPNPGAEFCIHVTLRSIQTGALLGSVLGPLSAIIFTNQREQGKSLRESFVDGGRTGALIGAVIGPCLTWYSMRDMSTVKLFDKCYRLRFDQEQLWLDRTTIISAAVGYLSNGTLGLVVGLDFALIMSNLVGKTWGN